MAFIMTALEGLGAGMAAEGGAMGSVASKAMGEGFMPVNPAVSRSGSFKTGQALGKLGNAVDNNYASPHGSNIANRGKLGSNDSVGTTGLNQTAEAAGNTGNVTTTSSLTDKTVSYE